MQELAGKVAVVTGAASGIGLALSRRLGADGMRVMMADVEAPALEAAAKSLAAEGVETATAVTDVSEAESVDALARATLDRFGGVHVVCNNAGVTGGGASWKIPAPVWNWIMGVNFFGIVHGIQAFAPQLIAQREGHIVNTASLAGLVTGPWLGPYSAAKHAVVAASEALYHELAAIDSPVGVSVLCPGFVRTRIHQADRNWLDRFGQAPSIDDLPGSDLIQKANEASVEAGLDPAIVAEAVRDAIVANRFWILTHPEMNDAVTDRWNRVVTGRNPDLTGAE
jgi:NAD(P)-dependent dehydrogenase (short-subunit alcohol dehydrogenase family)